MSTRRFLVYILWSKEYTHSIHTFGWKFSDFQWSMNAPDRKFTQLLLSPGLHAERLPAPANISSCPWCWPYRVYSYKTNMVEKSDPEWRHRCANRCVCCRSLAKRLASTRGEWVQVVCWHLKSSRCLWLPGATRGKFDEPRCLLFWLFKIVFFFSCIKVVC